MLFLYSEKELIVMENQVNRNNTLRDFLLELHLIHLREKKPPDSKAHSSLQPNYKNDCVFATKADSLGLVGDPKSR